MFCSDVHIGCTALDLLEKKTNIEISKIFRHALDVGQQGRRKKGTIYIQKHRVFTHFPATGHRYLPKLNFGNDYGHINNKRMKDVNKIKGFHSLLIHQSATLFQILT